MAIQLRFAPVLDRWPELLSGAIGTVTLAAQCIAIGLAIAVVCGVARAFGPRWLGALVGVYVEIIRNTPLLVQLSIVYFALPLIGIRLPAEQAAVIGLAINLGAYATEIIRAGLVAIPRTQIEAGLALGMHPLQVIRYVVVLPALKIIYPALTSQLTLTLLGTSIASAISAAELMAAGGVIESDTFRSFETYIVIGAIYIAIVFAFRLIYTAFGMWLFRRKGRPTRFSRLAGAPKAAVAP